MRENGLAGLLPERRGGIRGRCAAAIILIAPVGATVIVTASVIVISTVQLLLLLLLRFHLLQAIRVPGQRESNQTQIRDSIVIFFVVARVIVMITVSSAAGSPPPPLRLPPGAVLGSLPQCTQSTRHVEVEQGQGARLFVLAHCL